jgi:hypothetical protein
MIQYPCLERFCWPLFSYLTLISLGYYSIKAKHYSQYKRILTFYTHPELYISSSSTYILTTAVTDYILNIIIILNAIIAVFLGATAVTYLGRFGDSKAYFYAFVLIFNDIFIGVYFVENIVLNTIDRVLHFIAFYFIYLLFYSY